MTLQEEISRQVAAGQCVRGSTPTGCMVGDLEVACQTVRECAPSQHFEYSQPGLSPNVNIWTWNGSELNWSGSSATTPVTQPGIGVDMFGNLNPFVNYNAIPYVPSPVIGPPQGGTNPPVNRAPGNGSTSTAGPAVAPAYTLGLLGNIEAFLRASYNRTVVTQAEFCAAYTRFIGAACDFDSLETGSKEASAWLTQLQGQQNSRVSVIGQRPLQGSNSPIGGGGNAPVTQPTVIPPNTGGGGFGELFANPMVMILIVGAVLIARR